MKYKYIYIDYTNSISSPKMKFHGGGNYAKRIILLMSELNLDEYKIVVLWPKGYSSCDDDEEKILKSKNLLIQEINELHENILFQQEAVLFIPLLSVKKLGIVNKIKRASPSLKVYLTLHGLRLLDLLPDLYDKYYEKRIDYFLYRYSSYVRYIMKSYIYKIYIKKYLPAYDKVFTVSNFSLQQIIKITKVKFISYYYQGPILKIPKSISKINKEYILFVSGSRFEKNFIRALEAYSNYKMKTQNNLYLLVTGIKKEDTKLILRNNKINKDVFRNWVICYEYVDNDFLISLYKSAKFLLYVSKSEGFGLPVLEALIYQIPVVASYITSIPEVIGPLAYYVDPYDVKSIENGIAFMNLDTNREHYCNALINAREIIEKKIEIDTKKLIFEILE